MYGKANNIPFSHLIKEMHKIAGNYGRTAQRDTILDIADLYDCYVLADGNQSSVTRFWGIGMTGTTMCRTADFGDKEKDTSEKYIITWGNLSNWSIEEL